MALRKNLPLVLCSLLVAFAAAELILEFYDGAARRRDDRIHKPYYSYRLLTLDGQQIGGARGFLKMALHPFVGTIHFPGQKTPYFTINSVGFRGREVSKEKNGSKRIVLVGGSSAFGAGLDGDEETIAAHLERLIPGTEVINAAVIGHLSGNEYVYLATELVDYDPDLIIALDGWNDFYIQHTGPTRNAHTLGCGGEFFVIQHRLRMLYQLDSQPLHKKAAVMPKLLFSSIYSHFTKIAIPPERLSKNTMEEVVERHVLNKIKMHKLAASYNARFLSVLQPATPSSQDKVLSHYRDFASYVSEGMVRENVPNLNLAESKQISGEDFNDYIHMKNRGNELTAEAVADFISSRRLL